MASAATCFALWRAVPSASRGSRRGAASQRCRAQGAGRGQRSALHAEKGQNVKIADQRQAAHARAAFTFNIILRDLKVRQHSLNSGAANRGAPQVTKVYSEHVAADGRNLKLESGSLESVLRWEKRADVVCMVACFKAVVRVRVRACVCV